MKQSQSPTLKSLQQRERSETSKETGKMLSQVAAGGANVHLADNNESISRDGDDPEVYMLEESRRVYKKEWPPFVFNMSRKRGFSGDRRAVVLANDESRHLDESECQKAEIVCHVYTRALGFWTLDLNGARMIVKGRGVGRGAAYMIWWGPEEGFGEKAVAFSNRVPRAEVRTQSDDETKQPERDSLHEPSDGKTEVRSVDTVRPSPIRRHHSRNAKDKGRDKIKQLSAVMIETERGLKARRESQRLHVLQKQTRQAPTRPSVNNSARPNNPSFPTPSVRTSPTPSTGDSLLASIPMKRERSSSGDPTRPPPESSQRRPRNRSRSPSITEISHTTTPSIDRYMQSNTMLHISLSTNDHGTIPIQLRRCMTMETFFASVLSAWDQDGDEANVAAVAVTFDWLRGQGPMVVRKRVEDSFEMMLQTIAEAPVWGVADGRKRRCDVRVKIIMRE